MTNTGSPPESSEPSLAGGGSNNHKLTAPSRTNGARKIQERFERDASARRALFVGSLAGFVALFGFIATGGEPAPVPNLADSAVTSESAAASRIIAEVPITNRVGASDGVVTIVRIVAPTSRISVPHIRTRATG